MTIHRLNVADAPLFSNPDKKSWQIVSPQNARDARVTITRVTMDPGAVSERHSHPRSEQIWLVEQGRASLLLDEGQTVPIEAGDVIRTPAGEVHGIHNDGTDLFVYLTITNPPEDMSGFYEKDRQPCRVQGAGTENSG